MRPFVNFYANLSVMIQEIHKSHCFSPDFRDSHHHLRPAAVAPSGLPAGFLTAASTAASGEDSTEGDVAVMEGRPKLKQPPRFAVVLLNDDYTTMEFVVEVLQRFFQKQGEEAMQIMMLVHRTGQGVAGVYSHDIAETKAYQVNEYARSHGFPLKCVVKDAD
jgi:ATP-dependent Clp protease adaptor protein ClpS